MAIDLGERAGHANVDLLLQRKRPPVARPALGAKAFHNGRVSLAELSKRSRKEIQIGRAGEPGLVRLSIFLRELLDLEGELVRRVPRAVHHESALASRNEPKVPGGHASKGERTPRWERAAARRPPALPAAALRPIMVPHAADPFFPRLIPAALESSGRLRHPGGSVRGRG